jgi:hypothetical protein
MERIAQIRGLGPKHQCINLRGTSLVAGKMNVVIAGVFAFNKRYVALSTFA